MKIVNDNIKNALKTPTTQRKGKILVNDNYYEVYNVEYYADSYNDGNVIGNAIASQLDFDLPYMDKFDTFKYFDGVWTGNEYEYVDMGTFNVFDEQDEDEFNKHITAFDNLIKFNVPFEDKGDYPKTLFQELKNICSQAGVELINENITNGDFELENNQFVSNENLKNVLKAICQISGNYAIIKEDKLLLKLKSDNEKEYIEKKHHEPVIWKRKTYGINQLVIGMSDVEGEYVLREDLDDIAINGVHKLVINDNPFSYTQEKREQLIDELFDKVKGFGYVPYEMNTEWLNYYEIGDLISIDNVETLVLRINGKSPKSLESSISAPAIIDSAVTYANNTESILNRTKRTEIIVDKHNGEITSIAQNVSDVQDEFGNIYTKVEINELIQNAQDGLINTFSISGGSNLLRNTAPYFMTSEDEAEYWNGKVKQISESDAISGFALLIQNGLLSQSVAITNDIYSVSLKYKTLNNGASCKVRYNGKEFVLTEEEGEIHTSGQITSGQLTFEVECNSNNAFEIYDLMLKRGDEGANNVLVWTQNSNETISDTVQISKGITAFSNTTDTKATMDSEGFKVRNKTTDVIVMEATKSGGKFLDLTSTGKANISGLIIEKHDRQVWGTGG